LRLEQGREKSGLAFSRSNNKLPVHPDASSVPSAAIRIGSGGRAPL
jgi:hypothetical protein